MPQNVALKHLLLTKTLANFIVDLYLASEIILANRISTSGKDTIENVFFFGHKEVKINNTVKSAYKEPAYKEFPIVKNWFSFPNL